MSPSFSFQTTSPEKTQEVGEIIGRNAQQGDIFLLTGPLGAGKTCLSQGIARGLEIPGYQRSPTFVLMTQRQGRLLLNHVDLYRINDPWEAWDLGLDELLFGEGVSVIEWADNATELFPEASCWISMDYGPKESQRVLTVSADSPRYAPLLQCLNGTLVFNEAAGDEGERG